MRYYLCSMKGKHIFQTAESFSIQKPDQSISCGVVHKKIYQ